MLLIVEEGIRGGTCHAKHQYLTANNKYMKEYIKGNESSYVMYLDVFSCIVMYLDGQCFKKYLLMVLNGKNISKFNKSFIETIMKIVIKDIYLK